MLTALVCLPRIRRVVGPLRLWAGAGRLQRWPWRSRERLEGRLWPRLAGESLGLACASGRRNPALCAQYLELLNQLRCSAAPERIPDYDADDRTASRTGPLYP